MSTLSFPLKINIITIFKIKFMIFKFYLLFLFYLCYNHIIGE